jgi:hypothetical protein
VPFAVIPAVLKEIGFTGRPMLEIIAPDADAVIDDSVRRLTEAGYGRSRSG